MRTLEKITRHELEEIISDIELAETNQKIDLSDKDLTGLDLTSLSLSYFNLENDNISLSNCKLDRQALNYLQSLGRKNFKQVIIENQDLGLHYTANEEIGIALNQGFYFDELNLSDAIFKNCNLGHSTFKDCNLTKVIFENCNNVQEARSINCKQEGINITITDYVDQDTLPYNRFLQFIGNIISLKILGNMLGDGGV
ncbi:MAG: hypothetical protein K0Q51_1234 [Rickettsiaceae bacterium]|jgi:uncharacterized protein YjbI with pentapeptide repeats|nr:hypothetical protein [Rickettsiaceae bacterium]